MLQSYLRTLFSPQVDLEDFDAWRDHILSVVLFVTMVLGVLVAVPSALLALSDGVWPVALFDAIAAVWVVTIGLKSSLSLRARAWNLCVLLYVLGLALLVTVGAVSQIYLMAVPVMAALFLGLRPALFALVLNAVTLPATGYLANADLQLMGFAVQPLVKWIVISANFTFISSIITISIVVLLDGLEKVLAKKRASEESLNEAQQIAGVGSYILDFSTGHWESSHELDRLFGIDAGYERSVPGWEALTHPEDRGTIDQYFKNQTLGLHKTFNKEYRIVRQGDHKQRWVHGLGRLEFDAQGGLPKMIGTIQDITEHKQIQDVVLREKNFISAALDSVPGVFYVISDQGRFLRWNRNFEMLSGYSSEEVSRLSPTDLFAGPDKARVADRIRQVFVTGESTVEADLVAKDGTETPYFFTGALVQIDQKPCLIGMGIDISERKQAEDARAHREAELNESQRIARIGSWEWTIATGVVAWSEGMNHILGRDLGSPPPSFETLSQFYTAESWQRLGAAIATTVETGAPYEIEVEMIRPDGATCWTTTRGEAIRGADGAVVKLRGTVYDITEQKRAEISIMRLNRVYAMLSGINALIVRVHDRDELFREACRVAVDEGGFRMSLICIVDRSVMKIVPIASAGKDEELLTVIKGVLSSSEGARNSMVARAIREKKAVVSNDSQSDPGVLFGKQYADAGVRSMVVLPLIISDEALGVLALYADETDSFDKEEMTLLTELAGDIAFAMDHIEKQARLNYLAYYDELTGLANRTLFLERVAQYIRSAASGGHKLALFLTDLERFKNINDSLGRPAGDALLRQVAEWLKRDSGDANLVARVGADHFATVLPDVKQGGAGARLLEEKIKVFMDHPFRLNDAVFRVGAKVGVALFPDDGADAETLFTNAEAALKKAKASGERYLFYRQEMTEKMAGKLTLENQLRQALDKEEFVLHYQPKGSFASGKLTSAEALIRWNDPRTGLVPPGQFIPILEETGLIYEVGRWALRQAIADYLRWRNAGLPAVRIAVNVSPLQLRNRGFVDEIRQVIGIDAQASAGLELEITESLIMEDVKHNIASLQAIRAMGVTIAIDDFGTGFSSLSYLAKLPVDTLKIDRSFVIDMTTGPDGLALVSTIINLGHSLKLKVVAEGVETEEQSRLLRLLNCDEMQGYLFSKPVPGEIFETRFLATPSIA